MANGAREGRMMARLWAGPPGAEAERPFVLVHGLGVSSRYLIPLAEELARTHRVYAPDLPGWGRSTKLRPAILVAQHANALRTWMELAEVGPAVLIANSLGCQTIVDLAARFPSLVAGLILIGPTFDRTARSAWRQILRFVRTKAPPSLFPILLLDYTQSGARRIWRTFRRNLNDPIERKIAVVDAPVLVIRGEKDPIAPRRWCDELAQAAPDARVVEVAGEAHTPHFGAPAEVARLARELSACASFRPG
jgi:pimeloyl-ACP methyl ester carboxylesterase